MENERANKPSTGNNKDRQTGKNFSTALRRPTKEDKEKTVMRVID